MKRPTRPQVKTKKEKKSKDKKKDNKPASSESEEEESETESDSSKSDASTSEARNSKGGRKKLIQNFPKEDKLFAQKLVNAGDIVGLETYAGKDGMAKNCESALVLASQFYNIQSLIMIRFVVTQFFTSFSFTSWSLCLFI